MLPAVAFWLIWFLYPAVKAISISFYQYNYATPETNAFIGLDNYIRLFHDPKFFTAMGHSFLMVLIIVPLQTLISFAIAVLLNGKIRCKGIFPFQLLYSLRNFGCGGNDFLYVLFCKGWTRD